MTNLQSDVSNEAVASDEHERGVGRPEKVGQSDGRLLVQVGCDDQRKTLKEASINDKISFLKLECSTEVDRA